MKHMKPYSYDDDSQELRIRQLNSQLIELVKRRYYVDVPQYRFLVIFLLSISYALIFILDIGRLVNPLGIVSIYMMILLFGGLGAYALYIFITERKRIYTFRYDYTED